jgi:hypothetical protein
MRYHYVWLLWSLVFVGHWGVLFVANPGKRRAMWRTSLVTALFGVTEPLFVPRYWNPPSLFELAPRTGFDIESFIFAFAVGGIGMVLYTTLTRREFVSLGAADRREHRHRLHRVALIAPFALLIPGFLMPWDPIYPSVLALVLGALAAVICRPDLEVYLTFQVHNESIVVPETIDCIRALMGVERDGAASIAKTDAALGITKHFLPHTAASPT